MTTSNNTAARNFVPVTANILRESAKAYQVEVSYWTSAGAPVKKAKMWAPKSCSEVKDGVVTGIADFVLAGWEKDHYEYCRQFSRRGSEVKWDLAHREALREKAKKEADDYKALIKKVADFVKPYAKDEVATCAACWVVYGEYAAKELGIEDGMKLAEYGRELQKKYGVNKQVMDYCKEGIEKNHHDYKNVCLILQYYTVDTSILGEFRPDNEWLNAHNAGFTKDEYYKVAGICGVASGSLRTPLKKYVEARDKGKAIFFAWPKC